MDLELSEVFVCPRCRPAQGMVVLVDEMEGRRVLSGSLGCPECGRRVPVRSGVVRFDERTRAEGGGAEGEGAPDSPAGADSPNRDVGSRSDSEAEAKTRLGERLGGDPGTVAAALLGVADLEGPFLLGHGMAPFASRVAELAEGAEVLVLEGEVPSAEADGGRRSTRIRGIAPDDLPLFPRRMGGVALLAPGRAALEEGGRVVRSGGRLVVLAPREDPSAHLADGAFETVATDRRAWVGVRSG